MNIRIHFLRRLLTTVLLVIGIVIVGDTLATTLTAAGAGLAVTAQSTPGQSDPEHP